jgi:AcrR family transcriptional regulator
MTERGDTKTKILDVAEELFGLKGFEGVSLRDITTEAGVNLAAVNYHFQTKESLIGAVIARLMEPLNLRRLEMLDSYGEGATVEEILDAFLRTVMESSEQERLGTLFGRVLSHPELLSEKVFKMHLSPLAVRFRAAFGRALPGLTEEDVAWRVTFSIGVMTHTLLFARIMQQTTHGLCSMDDREALLQRMIAFDAAGFRAVKVGPQ